MRVPTIKELMYEHCKFFKYESGKLWYQIAYNYDVPAVSQFGTNYYKREVALFDFPVPVDDAGDGAFGTIEKPVTLMRWIRKHIEYLYKALEE